MTRKLCFIAVGFLFGFAFIMQSVLTASLLRPAGIPAVIMTAAGIQLPSIAVSMTDVGIQLTAQPTVQPTIVNMTDAGVQLSSTAANMTNAGVQLTAQPTVQPTIVNMTDAGGHPAQQFSDGGVLFEMTPADNWKKMGLGDWSSFGPSSTEGVPGGHFILYKNVCVSSHDGILVTPQSNLADPKNPNSAPLLTRMIPDIEKQNAFLLAGDALMGCCWRQQHKRRNPTHWMFGHGSVFSAAATPLNLVLNHVLFHQCAGTEDWPLMQAIESIVDKRAYDVGLFPRDGVNRITLPFNKAPCCRPSETIVCAERLLVVPTVNLGFFHRRPHVIDLWRRSIDAYLSEDGHDKCGLPKHKSVEGTSRSNGLTSCSPVCTRGLRVAVWQRSNRLITNIAEVEALLARYTDEPVMRLTADSSTTPEVQMMNFRCFDILVTVHGSQLAGMMFTKSSTQIFIEIQAWPGMDDPGHPFCQMGKTWASGYIISYGHLPVKPFTNSIDNDMTAKWDACFANVPLGEGNRVESYTMNKNQVDRNNTCSLLQMRRGAFSDKLVNIEYLRDDFELAVRNKCACKLAGDKGEFRCNMTFLPEGRLRKRGKRGKHNQ